ncbi:MAG: glycosyltransferase family 2 protein [Deltaproteobacteria bacterium]|nr:MAG: glycosyltransferase family 2 protein [Deltaproteobacteria bacterium]
MRVSVSIVTYRSRDSIDACLDSVRAQRDCVGEVLVVDNHPSEGIADHVRRRHPGASVASMARNAGYAAAHNYNFARAREAAFLALNPDVVLEPGFLGALIGALQADARVGAATGRLLAPGEPTSIDSAGIARGRARLRFVDRGRGERPARFDAEEDVFGPCGAAALYRRSALEAVCRPGEAPFAERFFMYYEDVDLAWRLRRAGFRARYVPRAQARHRRGGSGASPAFVEYHLVRNRLWLTLRNASGHDLLRELPGLALFEAAKLVQSIRRPHLRAALRDQLRGVRDCFRERRRAAARP